MVLRFTQEAIGGGEPAAFRVAFVPREIANE